MALSLQTSALPPPLFPSILLNLPLTLSKNFQPVQPQLGLLRRMALSLQTSANRRLCFSNFLSLLAILQGHSFAHAELIQPLQQSHLALLRDVLREVGLLTKFLCAMLAS